MTVGTALAQCDALKPNQIEQASKLLWLSQLENRIKLEIIDTHGGTELTAGQLPAYTQADLQEELLVPDPYADLYVKYLFAQIDFANAEFGRYNNSAILFNAAYLAFLHYYSRTHQAKQWHVKLFRGERA